MSRRPSLLALVLALGACGHTPAPSEVAERGWAAHARVIAAGEAAPTCALAGRAMRAAFTADRDAFVAAVALDRDKRKLAAAADYIATHGDRYRDLEARMDALATRCASEPAVTAVLDAMNDPEDETVIGSAAP